MISPGLTFVGQETSPDCGIHFEHSEEVRRHDTYRDTDGISRASQVSGVAVKRSNALK